MRFTPILLSTFMLLAVSACKTDHHVNSTEPVAMNPIERALPASTPFDGIADARAAYLQSYQEGYDRGLSGLGPGGPWYVGTRIDETDPRIQGWRDGSRAARLDVILDASKLRKK